VAGGGGQAEVRREISRDGKSYVYFRRKGVTFHGGAKRTAEDVKATYSRIVWPPPAMPLASKASTFRAERAAPTGNGRA
jgi:ABC-type transport system substrate-binding protein